MKKLLPLCLAALIAMLTLSTGGAPGAPASPRVAAPSSPLAASPASTWVEAPPDASEPRAEAGGRTLRIGAFNIQVFGQAKARRTNVLSVLAKIANTFDLLAIEEVGNNSSTASEETCEEVMRLFVARVNEVAGGEAWAYTRGDQYAILYRKDKLTLRDSGLYAGEEAFSYTPLMASFAARGGSLDFAVLVAHTSPSKAKREIPALREAMREVSERFDESDVILMGDLNADGSYYAEGAGTMLAGFENGCISAITNDLDTTVASSSNTYDRMELSQSLGEDWSGRAGVEEFGKRFDLSLCEGSEKRRGREAAVSDHYPVWADFYLDRDTD